MDWLWCQGLATMRGGWVAWSLGMVLYPEGQLLAEANKGVIEVKCLCVAGSQCCYSRFCMLGAFYPPHVSSIGVWCLLGSQGGCLVSRGVTVPQPPQGAVLGSQVYFSGLGGLLSLLSCALMAFCVVHWGGKVTCSPCQAFRHSLGLTRVTVCTRWRGRVIVVRVCFVWAYGPVASGETFLEGDSVFYQQCIRKLEATVSEGGCRDTASAALTGHHSPSLTPALPWENLTMVVVAIQGAPQVNYFSLTECRLYQSYISHIKVMSQSCKSQIKVTMRSVKSQLKVIYKSY